MVGINCARKSDLLHHKFDKDDFFVEHPGKNYSKSNLRTTKRDSIQIFRS